LTSPQEFDAQTEKEVQRILLALLQRVEESDYSRAEIQRQVGLSESFFRNIQSGRIKGIQLRNLLKILNFLGAEPGRFIRQGVSGEDTNLIAEALEGLEITDRVKLRRKHREERRRGLVREDQGA
jgi:DNA-binding Xre family transcriptional regulator